MKQNKDWTDVLRSTLRDAELTPPATSWTRLEQGLAQAPASRRAPMRMLWPKIAAVAAAILICVLTGELLWHEPPKTEPAATLAVTVLLSETPATEAAPVDVLHSEKPLIAAVRARHIIVEKPITASDPVVATLAQRPAQPASQAVDSSELAPKYTPERHSEKRATRTTTQTTRTTIFQDDLIAVNTPTRGKLSLGAFAAGALTGRSSGLGYAGQAMSDPSFSTPGLEPGTGASPGQLANSVRAAYNNGEFRHHQPLSFGLTLRKELRHGLSIESGLIYTLLWSDVRMPSGAEDFSQKLHMLGIPVRLNWNFYRHKDFILYIGAGGMFEKCVSAKFGSRSVEEPKVQWSVMGAAGAEYRLGKTVGLYFEPELSYYFTRTELRTYRTDSPATFTLRLGLRLSF